MPLTADASRSKPKVAHDQLSLHSPRLATLEEKLVLNE